jgi:hypothetical protein
MQWLATRWIGLSRFPKAVNGHVELTETPRRLAEPP